MMRQEGLSGQHRIQPAKANGVAMSQDLWRCELHIIDVDAVQALLVRNDPHSCTKVSRANFGNHCRDSAVEPIWWVQQMVTRVICSGAGLVATCLPRSARSIQLPCAMFLAACFEDSLKAIAPKGFSSCSTPSSKTSSFSSPLRFRECSPPPPILWPLSCG